MEEIGRSLLGIADSNQIYVAVANEPGVGIRIFVDAYRKDHEVRIVVMQLQQRGQLFNTGSAPRSPEIEEHHLTAIVGQMN